MMHNNIQFEISKAWMDSKSIIKAPKEMQGILMHSNATNFVVASIQHHQWEIMCGIPCQTNLPYYNHSQEIN